MSFTKVKQLRKNGQLSEALELALADFEKDDTDIWNKRSLAWVYYGFLKKATQQNNFAEFLKQTQNIKQLELPNTENMVFDSVAWQIGKLFFKLKEIKAGQLNNIFELVHDFYFTKKTGSYSFLLKAFVKKAGNWDRLIEFINWWGLDNFIDEDYKGFMLENGKKMIPLVETIYIAVSKKLLTGPISIENINKFIPKIAEIASNYKNMQYPPYYYAKLLLAIGDKSKFLDAFLPFAKKKQREFWVWDLLSGIYPKDSKEYFSCLCKSLSCGAPNKFTVNVKEKLAIYFEKNRQYAQAKRAYADILETRRKENWPLQTKHHNWKNKIWWAKTTETISNAKLYGANIQIAGNLLYANIPEELIILDYVNADKKVSSFIQSKDKHGYFNYEKLNIKPETAGVYLVRFKEKKEKKSSFYQIYTICKTDKMPPANMYKKLEATIDIRTGNSFGFANNIFVPPEIIKQHKLKNGDTITAISVISYNNKKKLWADKIIKIV